MGGGFLSETLELSDPATCAWNEFQMSSGTAEYDATLTITTTAAVRAAGLLHPTSCTHSCDNNRRLIDLPITPAASGRPHRHAVLEPGAGPARLVPRGRGGQRPDSLDRAVAAPESGRARTRVTPEMRHPGPLLRTTVEGMTAEYRHLLVKRDGDTITVTMNRPDRRNALSADHLAELLSAFRAAGDTDATGIVLAAAGPVFSAGHDFADVAARDLLGVRDLLTLCQQVMTTLETVPQVVIARVHGLATAAGCQLVASCDLAVAADSAGFALPGGKGGWFCHTPAVPVARSIGRKRLMELALTGDVIDARTAVDWGLINYAVPDADLDDAVADLLARATRGSRASKALGKRTLYAQLDRPEADAYTLAREVMAAASQLPGAREGMAAFLEKRHPVWPD
ncbi:enoyl-CoA hydratase-related protein [Nocardia sp. CA-151230]|uniref:enoyl-CoA hydratase-related protein n=1 Tax=Nocardia sp. CA-151230 TaxID=3239982 RepID=UPI003D8E6BC3